MGEFKVHHVRFFDYTPKAIHCLAYSDTHQKLALSRSDGSIEIWSVKDHWYQEKCLVPGDGASVEALVWCSDRLFSAGLHGNLHEHDLLIGATKASVSSNSGAIWCLTMNDAKTHIAAGTEDGCVVLFSVMEDSVQYQRSFDKQESRILSIAWLSSENVIITGGIDNMRVWSTTSGHAIQRLTLGRQERNKETIVWAVAVTNDFIIISGDSRGKTCFWNGKQGTLLKSFQSHKADVLAVAVNDGGDCVYSSGIDPTLAQFEFIASQPSSDWKQWVSAKVRNQHSHDVRALTITREAVVSAGVDCQLILNPLEGHKGLKKFRRVPPVPSAPLVYTAAEAGSFMLRYDNYLELWRLGATNKSSDKNGELLPLSKNAVKLLQLKSKGEEIIKCAAISDKADWLAYSVHNSLKLFQINIEDNDIGAPRVAVSRVRCLPQSVQAAECMAFTPDGSTLVLATVEGKLQLMKVDALQPEMIHTFKPRSELVSGIHLLSISSNGRFIATGGHDNHVHLYNAEKRQYVCSLPHYAYQPTAIGFHPTKTELAIAYADQKIVEYNFTLKEYTPWCRQLSGQWHPQWLKRHSKMTQLMYNPQRPHEILVRDDQMFAVINKKQPLPTPEQKLFHRAMVPSKEGKDPQIKHAFHICNKFRYLLHLDVLPDNYLLVVERPHLAIMETLPPTLKQKKFGT